MKDYILSPRARTDIEEIWEHSADLWGTAQAEQYIREIQRTIAFIAANPRHGRACDDIRMGYFKYPTGSHMIFYRLRGCLVDVVRILHQRMDFGRHLR